MRLGGNIEKGENGSTRFNSPEDRDKSANVTDLNLFISDPTNIANGLKALRSLRLQLLYGYKKDISVAVSDIPGSIIAKLGNDKLKNGIFGIKPIIYHAKNDEVQGKLNPIPIKEETKIHTLVYRLKSGTQTYDITLGSLGLPKT